MTGIPPLIWRLARTSLAKAASAIDGKPDTYANVAQVTLDALTALAHDVRSARQIKGGIPVKVKT